MSKHTPPSDGFKKFRALLVKVIPFSSRSLFNELTWQEQQNLRSKRKWDAPPIGTVEKESEISYDTYLQGNRVNTGGVSGGSCWDTGEGDPHHAYTIDDHEPIELEELDALLTEICPNITFLQYKRLRSLAKVETTSETEHEYYGNSSNYSRQRVKVGHLYDALCEMNLLPSQYGGAE